MNGDPAVIVTVTLNPAIDLTVEVEGLRPGTVHRARSVERNAGGKGVNVASCLADWGVPVVATGVLGRDNAATFESLFTVKGIADRFLRAPGDTRTNIKLADTATGDTTDINLSGLTVDGAMLRHLDGVLAGVVTNGTLVVLAGSLPAGVPAEAYARLCADIRGRGGRVVLDTSGAPLAASLGAPAAALPYAVKPNRHELEAFTGTPLPDGPAVLSAAGALVARGIALVVVSLGSEGALFVSAERAVRCRLPPVAALSTVGAGDAMVAGIVAALGADAPLERLARLSVAFAAAKLARVGPHLPAPTVVETLAAQAALDPV